MWDIAGQDHYAGMSRVYYNGALGAIVMCDVNSKKSIEGANKWKHNIDERVLFDGTKIPTFLVGNKIDLIESQKELEDLKEQFESIVKTEEFDGFELVSVKMNCNLTDCFHKLAMLILERFGDILAVNVLEDNNNLDLKKKNNGNSDGCC